MLLVSLATSLVLEVHISVSTAIGPALDVATPLYSWVALIMTSWELIFPVTQRQLPK